MAAALVNQTTGNLGTAGTTTTIAVTATPGNSLILAIGTGLGATGSISAVSDTGGNTWQLPDPPYIGSSGGTNTLMRIAYVHNCVNPGTISVTHGSTLTQVVVLEVSGLMNAVPDATNENPDAGATTTALTTGSVTTTQDGDFLVGAIDHGGIVAVSGLTAGWTALNTPPGTPPPNLRAAYKVATTAGVEQMNYTAATGVRFAGGIIAFKATTATASLPMSNDAEGGTNGVGVTAANSGGASGDAFASVAIGSGSLVFDNTQVAHDTLAYKCAGTTANVNTQASLTWTPLVGELYFRFNFLMTAVSTGVTRIFRTLGGATGSATLAINANGTFQWFATSTGNVAVGTPSTSIIPLNTWVRFEGRIVHSTVAGQPILDLQYYADDNSKTLTEELVVDGTVDATLVTGTDTVDTVRSFGQVSGGPIPASGWWFDDMALATSWIGPVPTYGMGVYGSASGTYGVLEQGTRTPLTLLASVGSSVSRGPFTIGALRVATESTAVSRGVTNITATRSTTAVTGASSRTQTNKTTILAATLASNIAQLRQTKKTTAATSTTATTLATSKAFGKTIALAVASAITSNRFISTTKPTATQANSVTVVKRPNLTRNATLTNTASVIKTAGVVRSATEITQIFFATARAYLTTQNATVATLATARRTVGLTRAATEATAVTTSRAISVIRTLTEATAASATKRTTRSATATEATVASRSLRPNKVATATQPTSVSLGQRAIARALTAVEATAVTAVKFTRIAIASALQGTSASATGIRAFLLSLAASQPTQATAAKQPRISKFAQASVVASRVLQAMPVRLTTEPTSVTATKRTAITRSVTQGNTVTSAFQRVALRTINLTVVTTAAIAKRINATQNIAVTTAVIKTARISRTLVTSITTAVAVTKQSRLTKLIAEATAASIITSSVRPLTILAQAATNALASRRVDHTEGVVLDTQTRVTKGITHEILASIHPAAKEAAKPVFGIELSAVVNAVVSVLANFVSSGRIPDFKHHKSQGGMRGSVTHGREAGSRGKSGGGSGGHGGLGGVHGQSSTKQKRVVR
jgi:hypothetical protein